MPHEPVSSTRRRWYSYASAGEEIGRSTRTIRKYVAAGVLPAYRIAGSNGVRIAAEDLDKLLRPISTVAVADSEDRGDRG